MERVLVVNCALCVIIVFLIGAVYSTPQDNTQLSTEEKERCRKYLWSGPLAGRRKRTPADDYNNLVLDSEESEGTPLIHFARNAPLPIMLIKSGKRYIYTPRMGRNSGEEFMDAGDRWVDEPELTADFLTQRSPPFAPRLGRHLSHYYSPRLGREMGGKNDLASS